MGIEDATQPATFEAAWNDVITRFNQALRAHAPDSAVVAMLDELFDAWDYRLQAARHYVKESQHEP